MIVDCEAAARNKRDLLPSLLFKKIRFVNQNTSYHKYHDVGVTVPHK